MGNTCWVRRIGPCLVGLVLAVASGAVVAQSFEVQPLTQPDHSLLRPGRVDTILRLADGRYLVGGLFDRMAGRSVPGTVRLQLDGALDPTFTAGLPNATDFAVDSLGRVYACNGSRLVRLAADGSLDAGFPAITPNSGGRIDRIEIDGDALLVSGTFASLNGQARNRLAKVSTAGVVDPAWIVNHNYTVLDLRAPGDGFVYVAGNGSTLGGASRAAVGRIAVAGDGTADAWDPQLGGSIRSVRGIAADADGLFIAGEFASVRGSPRGNLARIGRDAAATLDPAITTALSGTVGLVRVIGTHLYLGSNQARLTATLGGSSVQRRLLRLDRASGAIDAAFDPLADTEPSELPAQARSIGPGDGGGRLLIGGDFARLSGGALRLGLAPLAADGSLDTLGAAPEATVPGLLRAIQVDPVGGAYVVGTFERVNGAARRNLFRLAPNGSVDGSFRPPNVDISAAALHVGQALYIADRSTNSVRRLDPATGAVLPGFSIAYTQVVGDLEVVGPHLYWYGSFQVTSVNPTLSGYARMALASGAMDTGYRPLLAGSVSRTLFDPATQSLVLVGTLSSAEGQPRTGLARYDANTLALDAAWNPVLSTSSNLSAALDGAGGLYIGGNFTTVNGAPCRGPARLLLAGGGTLDAAFPCTRSSTQAQTVAFDQGRVYGAAFNQPLRRFLPALGGIADPDWSAPVDTAPTRFAFDASRVFVLGGFGQITSLPRDGLAALPVVDRQFVDGFESP